jgi:hypothetical protein
MTHKSRHLLLIKAERCRTAIICSDCPFKLGSNGRRYNHIDLGTTCQYDKIRIKR